MVRADQGIKGRAAPKAKSRSSVTSEIKARTAPTPVAPPQHITKAAKRALKRSELMSQVKGNTAQSSPLQLQPTNLSKSGLRRYKRKQKEQLAGNTQGMKDLEDAMDEVLEPEQDDDAEDFDEQYETEAPQAPPSTTLIGDKAVKRNGAVTEKARKKALTTEMARQNLILSDPAYAKSPFEALRLHAQNTLAFDKGAPRKRPPQ